MSDSDKKNDPPKASDSSDSSSKRSARRHTPVEDYGYDFYPERLEGKRKTIWDRLKEGRSAGDELKCIKNVYYCYRKRVRHEMLDSRKRRYPFVRLLVGALKSHGCNFDPPRHISCENCVTKVNGGYDPKNNQIVVCKNNTKAENVCCSVMIHEMIHMFDFCRAKADFTNLEHLACTEIRAAALTHCSFLGYMNEGGASYFNYTKRHQECVKEKASMSVMLVRDITDEEARSVVDQVFPKCYKDREPFGRIPRKGSKDPDRILSEAYLYGYTD